MKFVEKYLAKDIRDLTMQDIRSYFTNPRQESDTIEYKSYFNRNQNNHGHKESAILKSICGLLNSEGGMIIWGAPVEQTNQDTGLKEYQGDLSLIDRTIDKDSFVSKISQLITPIPSNILVEIIPEGDSCV